VVGTAGSSKEAPTPEEWREQGCCGCVFRDLSCGYRGRANWCDHSRARCEDIGNGERYDGAKPDLIVREKLHPVDVLAALLCVTCYAMAWPWGLALPTYTVACGIFIPQVRYQAIMFWVLHVQPLRRHFVKPLDIGPQD